MRKNMSPPQLTDPPDQHTPPRLDFGNLGFVRRLYLPLNWTITFVLVGVLLLIATVAPPIAVLALIPIGYMCWLHNAVSTRNTRHMAYLAGLTLIPLCNPIAAAVLLFVRMATSEELQRLQFEAARR